MCVLVRGKLVMLDGIRSWKASFVGYECYAEGRDGYCY